MTSSELRLRYHLGNDPYAPHNNILAGAAYLRERHDRYGPAGYLAAYNAGPDRYEDYLARGRPLPDETRNYVAALASKIGVPTLPPHPESTLVQSSSSIIVAAHVSSAQRTIVHENRLSPRISPFENRPVTRTRTLFAAIHVAFEQTLASAHIDDVTALEPSANRALTAISPSENHPPDRILKTTQSSLEPSGNGLFAVRSWRSGKSQP